MKKMISLLMTALLLVATASGMVAVNAAPDEGFFARGDVNADGVINIDDILRIRDHVFGIKKLTGDLLLAADINRDGKVDINDMLALRDHIFGTVLLPWIPSSITESLAGGCASYAELYEALEKKDVDPYRMLRNGGFTNDGMPVPTSEPTLSAPPADDAAKTPDFSDTNNQVEGMQEADIVKTDGKNIYACTFDRYNYHQDWARPLPMPGFVVTDALPIDTPEPYQPKPETVRIVACEDGEMEEIAVITVNRESAGFVYNMREMLLYGDRLILIKDGSARVQHETNTYDWWKSSTAVEIYDISDPANPVFVNELYQSGNYNTSRMEGQYFYLITGYTVYNAVEDRPETFVPTVSDYKHNKLMAPHRVMKPVDICSDYTVITGADVLNPVEHISSAALLGWSGTVYASLDNLYVTSTKGNNINGYTKQSTWPQRIVGLNTQIDRFAISEGNVSYGAGCVVDGQLINQFAMDEYEGHLRLATTVDYYKIATSYDEYLKSDYYWYENDGTENQLIILDLDLKCVSTIKSIAPGERIQSVRFNGPVGYVVTFLRV
ncbi:MAG: beta-propeller domain-containing protein, partial [Clostridia bacterium]|nr:beta-propeller domain-containing protein [Clostridia bacterium]